MAEPTDTERTGESGGPIGSVDDEVGDFTLPAESSAPSVYDRLDSNDIGFLHRVYEGGLTPYLERLRQIAFDEMGSVLDAGCGFGQWTFALARLSGQVTGLDIAPERLRLCESISDTNNVTNADFTRGTLESLPFESNHFDGVFSYSAVYFADFPEVASEFSRVLKPGGRLYLSTNGLGKYLYDIVAKPNPADDYNPRVFGLKTIRNTLVGRTDGLSLQSGARVMTPTGTTETLRDAGFVNIATGGDGELTAAGHEQTAPSFYDQRYLGVTKVFECLAEKPPA
jgi:SAM-dependent methyltransferase